MPLILTILILFFQTVNAEEIKFGTYSLATEAGWTAWFELKPNNSAMISPAYDTEDLDPASFSRFGVLIEYRNLA